MSKSRRLFLKQGLLAGTAALIGKNAHASEKAAGFPVLPEFSDDENYWKLVRQQFPLDNRTFLNNGTMGPCPFPVIEAVKQSLDKTNGQAVYGGGETEALESLARFLRVKKETLALTHNVTEGISIAAFGLKLKKGDEIILSKHEHVGNALPWLNRAKIDGLCIKSIDLGKTAAETLDIVKKTITSKTRVIALPQIPCTIGQILPTKEICALAREKGIITFVDGAHPPGMLDLNIEELGCDIYAGCCHKWMLAPAGTGFLYVSEAFRESLQALFVGGGSDTGWDLLSNPPVLKGYAASSHRYYYGTQSAALYFGIDAAIRFQETIGRQAIEKRIRSLAKYLQDGLLDMGNKIEMLTPTEDISRGAQIGFRIAGTDNGKVQHALSEKRIIIRYVPENGLNNLRVSTHIYNNKEEVDLLLNEIRNYKE